MMKIVLCVSVFTLAGLVGCTQVQPEKPATSVAAQQPSALNELLPKLATSYEDRIKLGTFAGTFLRPVDDSLKPYFSSLRERNKALLDELKPLAKKGKIDLDAKPADTLDNRARPIMEKRQEGFARAADQAAFEHDMLMHMYNDHEWMASLIEATLPGVSDPAMKAYLEKAMRLQRAIADDTKKQLRRYKLQK